MRGRPTVTTWRNVNPAAVAAASMRRRVVEPTRNDTSATSLSASNSICRRRASGWSSRRTTHSCSTPRLSVRCEVGQIADIADPEIREAASHIVPDVILEAFAQLDLDAGKAPPVLGDHAAHVDRDQAGHDDLTALLPGQIAQASHAELHVVEHALSHRDEFATGRCDRDLARACAGTAVARASARAA